MWKPVLVVQGLMSRPPPRPVLCCQVIEMDTAVFSCLLMQCGFLRCCAPLWTDIEIPVIALLVDLHAAHALVN